MPCLYIIYSRSLDQYYTGASNQTFDLRLKSHLSGKYRSGFTIKATDWEEYLIIKVDSYGHARKMENHIK